MRHGLFLLHRASTCAGGNNARKFGLILIHSSFKVCDLNYDLQRKQWNVGELPTMLQITKKKFNIKQNEYSCKNFVLDSVSSIYLSVSSFNISFTHCFLPFCTTVHNDRSVFKQQGMLNGGLHFVQYLYCTVPSHLFFLWLSAFLLTFGFLIAQICILWHLFLHGALVNIHKINREF